MKKVKLFEEYIQEATTSWSKMMKGVKAGDGGPWSIVAIEYNKVVGQSNDIKIRDLIPAKYEALKKEFPRAKFHIEDAGGGVVWNESYFNEGIDSMVKNLETLEKNENSSLSESLSSSDKKKFEEFFKNAVGKNVTITADDYSEEGKLETSNGMYSVNGGDMSIEVDYLVSTNDMKIMSISSNKLVYRHGDVWTIEIN